MSTYTFKIADQAWEFEQIHALNYATFVEEIPQHIVNPSRRLTDAFHAENTYLVCMRDRDVAAMLAVRGQRPFSLDKKLDNLDAYLPPDRSLCEVRLLAARKSVRNTRILRGLIAETVRYCLSRRYDTALISGIVSQQKLYTHLGFVPFGPVVGNGDARFQPMYLTLEAHAAAQTSFAVINEAPVNFLPGPVDLSASVQQALTAPPLSHRSGDYLALHHETQKHLTELVSAEQVGIFTGSGTLANDVIAGQLSLLPGKGLILSNGEFGQRLIQQARRFGLTFETLSLPWGQPYEERSLYETIRQTSGLQWLWTVHLESSTGMLNDLAVLKKVARDRGLYLCLDCVSSIGNAPMNLQDVYLASACSSKGLRSIAGLAMVFYNHRLTPPCKPLPIYLDLYGYEQAEGVPFSIPSNLVAALAAALKECNLAQRFSRIETLNSRLRRVLGRVGLTPLVSGSAAGSSIMTIPLQSPLNSQNIGDRLKNAGFWVSYESHYLLERNWIQLCLMSDVPNSRIRDFTIALEAILAES